MGFLKSCIFYIVHQKLSRLSEKNQTAHRLKTIGLAQGFPNFYLIGTIWTL